MITKKKRNTIIITVLGLAVILIAILVILLYNNTDMLKSNKTLFIKYVGKNIENINEIKDVFKQTEFDNLLQTNPYSEKMDIKVNYTKNIGTTAENTDNVINKLNLEIESQKDEKNNYQHQDIKLLKEENPAISIETIMQDNTYGIRFSDLFKQYILVENKDLKELAKKIGYTDEQIENIPNNIENYHDILNGINFSKEELETLQNKYVSILNNKFANNQFEKQKNQNITINGKNIKTNIYILKMTKEQLNNIYIEILKNLKEDEVILKKIENIQKEIDKTKIIFQENIDIKQNIINKIEKIIEEITKNNIGNEETKIIVYESEGKTVRTTIEGVDYEFIYDYLQTEQEKFWEVIVKKDKEEIEKITLYNKDDEAKLLLENNENDNFKKIELNKKRNIKDKNCLKNIEIKYEDDTNRIECILTQNINIVDNLEKQITVNNQNSINLNTLEQGQLQEVLNKVEEGVNKKIEELNQQIKIEDINDILKTLGIVQEKQQLETSVLSDVEINQFNSKFEILQGENIDNDNVIKTIEAIKENLINFEVVSNEELKIQIDQNNKNEDSINTLKKFFEKGNNRKYNIKVENDNETGLVRYLIIQIVKENKN